MAELNSSDSKVGEASDKKVDYTALSEENLDKLPRDGPEASSYLGMFGENYHLADLAGSSLRMGDNVYVLNDISLLTKQPLLSLLEDQAIAENVFDLKGTVVGLYRLGIRSRNMSHDILLVSYLVDNEDNSNDLGEICQLHSYYNLQPDIGIYEKGKKAIILEETVSFNHLAGKILAIEVLKPILLERLTEHE